MILLISLENCSPGRRSVRAPIEPEYGFLSVFVSRPGEKEDFRYHSGVSRESGGFEKARGTRERTLAPGESLTAWLHLYYDRQGWVLTRPGTYHVRSAYPVGDSAVRSNVVRLDVKEGSSKADRGAARLLMAPGLGLLLVQGGGAPDHKGRKGAEEVLRRYPESRLASYARLAIGLSHARQFFDAKSRSFRPADCPRAIEQLQNALRALPDPLFAATGTASLTECLRSLGREREIGAAVQAYFGRHPGSRRLPGISEMLLPRAAATSR